ncbi:hypothetical protein [Sulfurimonas aquatica]|nr:hypothetical protein [Sulfurimonas aquatica]
MNHVYLSETVINNALATHVITSVEAEMLKKKVDCQVSIYKATHKL